jgi:ribonuclease HII
MSQPPNFDEENKLRLQGYTSIAGIDEAGRGALAGPVVAAAVILPYPGSLCWLALVRDSKQLAAKKRQRLFDLIQKEALAVGIGIVPPSVIDSVNILRATEVAMWQAVERLPQQPDFILIDRLTLPECSIPQRGITRGDRLCLSIACASIMAKVTRDHIMEGLDKVYPGYGFAKHKGYGTSEHGSSLRQLGCLPIHRLSFAPVRSVLASSSPPVRLDSSIPSSLRAERSNLVTPTVNSSRNPAGRGRGWANRRQVK